MKRTVARGKSGDRDGFVKLGGYEFKRVKNGLDEAQVASSINEFISQKEALHTVGRDGGSTP